MTNGYHPLTWLIWTLMAAVLAILTMNPLYLILLGLAAGVNYLAVSQRSPLARSWSAFIKLGLWIWAITVPFNAFMTHQGRYVLFSLPASWPLIGGKITLEAAIYGFVRGLSLIVILIIFAAFNSAVDQARLLRRMPAFLYLVSITTSIALAFVPQMLSLMKEIQEAQRIRGHRFRGIRDLLPLFVPLLTSSMERAIQLAESMESRGFGGNIAPASPARELAYKVATLAGLLMILFGVFASSYWLDRRWIGLACCVAGGCLLAVVFWAQSRRVKRTRYRRDKWLPRDGAIVSASLLALAGALVLRLTDRMALFYYPYPPYTVWPAFDPRVGVLFLLLAMPAVLLPMRGEAPAAENGERREHVRSNSTRSATIHGIAPYPVSMSGISRHDPV